MTRPVEHSPPASTASNPAAPVLPPAWRGLVDERARRAPATVRLAGRSAAYREMLEWLERAAASRLPLLILGETGAGKEVVARAVHQASPRRTGPLVAVCCTALPDTLLDAELFGVVRGAYTGADRDRAGLFRAADGGTLFLDEVGDMPAAMQAKLLRTLEQRRVRPVGGGEEVPVDVRVISASHRDLRRAAAAGRFRSDLYHRLAVLELRVPPLRERLDDLPLLVRGLAPRLREETGLSGPTLTAEAWRELRAHDWPGNVRELHAVLARALLRTGGGPIGPQDLRLADAPPVASGDSPGLEQTMIESALREARGNITEAAARIGWTRQKLYRRLRDLGIERHA